MIVFFGFFDSNFNSCCLDQAAPNETACHSFGMASSQGGLWQVALEGSSLPPATFTVRWGAPLLPFPITPEQHARGSFKTQLSCSPLPQRLGSIATASSW